MAIAPDELQTLDEQAISQLEGSYECLDGRYVEKPSMGAQANELAFLLLVRLHSHVREHKLGRVFTDNLTYKIFADEPKRSRIPDGSFVRSGRLPDDKAPRGHMTIPPDLAIEVVSPNDIIETHEERIGDLMRAGVRLLWVVVPATRQVYVHRADGTISRLNDTDDLSGEDVIPGFVCPLGELFDSV